MKKIYVLILIMLMFVPMIGVGASGKVTATQPVDFSDVSPESDYYEAIEKVTDAGIMEGYFEDGQWKFKPGNPVTRQEAALYIERAAFGLTTPQGNGSYFSDVASNSFYKPWVEDFYNRGITNGCGANLYCPTSNLLREQIAPLILRSLGQFTPPTPTFQRFTDVPSSNPFYAFIDRLAVLGITHGCTTTAYCPSAPVLRSEMALFLVRAYGL